MKTSAVKNKETLHDEEDFKGSNGFFENGNHDGKNSQEEFSSDNELGPSNLSTKLKNGVCEETDFLDSAHSDTESKQETESKEETMHSESYASKESFMNDAQDASSSSFSGNDDSSDGFNNNSVFQKNSSMADMRLNTPGG